MKKSVALIFEEKYDAQISGFVVKKAPSPWKQYFLKKNPASLSVQIRPTKQCAENC